MVGFVVHLQGDDHYCFSDWSDCLHLCFCPFGRQLQLHWTWESQCDMLVGHLACLPFPAQNAVWMWLACLSEWSVWAAWCWKQPLLFKHDENHHVCQELTFSESTHWAIISNKWWMYTLHSFAGLPTMCMAKPVRLWLDLISQISNANFCCSVFITVKVHRYTLRQGTG